MRDAHNEIKGKLFGIGIGPGDPKLLTIKAKEILNNVDTIFAPKADVDGISCARSIVEAAICGRKDFVELTFPMTKDKNVLDEYWQKAAQSIAKEVRKNKIVAFITIGDPLIYSTYIYLLKTLRQNFPDIPVETIPGISSFNAAACASGIALAQGNERLAIVPVTKDLKAVKDALQKFDTVILIKVGSKLDKVVRLLKSTGLLEASTLISHIGHGNEAIIRDLSSLKEKKLGYLSVIIVKRKI